MRLLALLCCCLLPSCAVAQTTISGRVLDAKSGDALSGATILQTGTTNGTPSNAEGNFTLAIPASLESIALTFSLIGYLTQRQRVAASSTVTIHLAIDPKPISDCPVAPSKFALSLTSGLRYTPFGANVTLYGSRLIRVPLTASASYRTDFARNHTVSIGLNLPSIRQFRTVNFTENLEYQQLWAPAANTRFTSYTGMLGIDVGFIGRVRVPTLGLGAGYAQWRPLMDDATGTSSGYGYTFGLKDNVLPYPFNIDGIVMGTRWPGYWQWQGRLTHGLPHHLQAGVALNQLRNYTEFFLIMTRFFY